MPSLSTIVFLFSTSLILASITSPGSNEYSSNLPGISRHLPKNMRSIMKTLFLCSMTTPTTVSSVFGVQEPSSGTTPLESGSYMPIILAVGLAVLYVGVLYPHAV